MALYRILGSTELSPSVHATAYVAESADVIGDVRLAENTSIWSHVTLRGDNETISIGARSNVQESSVLHTDIGFPLVIGENVNFLGAEESLRGNGVELTVVQDEECIEMMRRFIAEKPELWNEDIGV